ncbi:MAG: peptidoglycan-binding protein [Thiotrichales bacterium]
MKLYQVTTAASLSLLVALGSGCSTTQTPMTTSAAEKEYESKLKALQERESQLAARELAPVAAAPAQVTMSGDEMLPPNAKSGECYARIWIPPQFKTVTEQVLQKAEGEKIEVDPAQYEWSTERVLVSDASERLETIPATYKTVSERVLVRSGETFWTFGTSGPASAKGPNAKVADAARLNIAKSNGVPESAQIGQCFAEYYIPGKYGTKTEQVLAAEGSQKIEVIPARYENVTERVMVKGPSERVETVPAQYKDESEQVLVRAAHTTWQISECSGGACEPGQMPNRVRGVAERIDNATGEIMCLVEVPAEYRTVTKRVMVSPPTTRRIEIPAEYKTVTIRKMVTPPQERAVEIPAKYQTVSRTEKLSDPVTSWHMVGAQSVSTAGTPTGDVFCLNQRPDEYKTVTRQVVDTAAATRKVAIPAQYTDVKVNKMVKPAAERRIAIPASYQTVTRTERVSEGRMEWKSVICQVNMTRERIMDIQRALTAKGHYKGPIDGIVGSMTISAMQKFQAAQGLPTTRYLTTETITALGVATR